MRDDSHKAAHAERLRVFLCHASEDRPQVFDLYRRLSEDGFQPWLDIKDLLVGEVWETGIRKAVRASHAVVVCLSRHSVSKPGFVQREILYALEVAEEQPEGAIFVLPFKLEPCDIPDRLHTRHCASLFDEDGYPRLVKSLRECARVRGIFTPGPDDPSVSPAGGADDAKHVPPPPSYVRRIQSPRPVRPPGNGSAMSRPLTLAGAALLVAAVAVLIGLGLRNRGAEKVADVPVDSSVIKSSLAREEAADAGPTVLPEPQEQNTPEPPPAKTPEPTPTVTPAPSVPGAEGGRVGNKNDPSPSSIKEAAPPAPKPSSGLGRYEVQLFLTRGSQNQRPFRKDIARYLRPRTGKVTLRDDEFFTISAKGCQIRYLDSGGDEAGDEGEAASALLGLLNKAYPKANFKGVQIPDRRTPNIVTLVIGPGCKKS